MMRPGQDPGRTTDAVRDSWDRVAAGWARWSETIERGARPVSERLVAMAALSPGHRVLDVATGVGEPAATAARRVAPGGRVVAGDIAPAMLTHARARAEALGLGNIEFRILDAAAPDLPAAGFDAVLSRWGLMFVPDPVRTFSALQRTLKPGGRLAFAVWGPPEKAPGISLPNRILSEWLDPVPLSEDAPAAFSLSDGEAVASMLRRSGFAEIVCEPMTVTFEFDSVQTFVRFRRDSSTVGARADDCPPERRDAAWRAVADAMQPFAAGDGALAIPNLAVCWSARR